MRQWLTISKLFEKRGHRFVRYADDCNIYVKSKRAGQRVYASIKTYLETKLKLKVNESKSAVASPIKRKFLGFSFYYKKGGIPAIRIHNRSYQKFKEKIRRVINRNWGVSMNYRLKKLAETTNGWLNYFGIADAGNKIQSLDEWIRRRLRTCITNHRLELKGFKSLVKRYQVVH